jgi:hypothetical protein
MRSSGRTARKCKANELTAPTGTDQTGPSSSVAPSSKKSYRPLQDNDSEVDENVCCVCFMSYLEDIVDGDGCEWIKCACGRWLHEDCTEIVWLMLMERMLTKRKYFVTVALTFYTSPHYMSLCVITIALYSLFV